MNDEEVIEMDAVAGLLILFIILAIMVMSGIPIGFSLLIVSLFSLIYLNGMDITMAIDTAINRMMYGVNSFPLLAIPFFIWVGRLLAHDAMSTKLFGIIKQAVGWWKGGVAHFNIFESAVYAAMSGSAVSDVLGPGRLSIRYMLMQGYPLGFAVALTCATAILGPIIPPSIPLIVWGAMGNVSIGKAWFGLVGPGILLVGLYVVTVYIIALIKNFPSSEKPTLHEFIKATKDALPALLAPVILWGGIFSGIFTPTEAAVVAVAYVLFISATFYRGISLHDHLEIMKETVKDSAAILFIVAVANVFSWSLTFAKAQEYIINAVFSVTTNPTAILAIISVVLIFLGMFVDVTPLIVMTAPFIIPLGLKAGIDPTHLTVVSLVAINIGLVTPPFGTVLFAGMRVANIDMEELVRNLVPFYIPIFLTLILIILFPQLSTYIPKIIYGG